MTDISKAGKAYADGWDAREDGEPRSDGELIADGEERTAWFQGWDEANENAEEPHDEEQDRDSRWTGGGIKIFTVKDADGRTLRE